MSKETRTPEQIAEEESKAKLAAAEAKTAVKARVLVDCEYGPVNSVARIPKAALVAAERAGLVDSDKSAVAYAESIAKA